MDHEARGSDLTRRNFLARAMGGVAGLAATGIAAPEERKLDWRNRQPTMAYARLGRTNFMMSRVAFGMARITRANIHLIPRTLERGLNYLDTSIWYMNGQSEMALGTILSRFRDKVWVTSKAPNIGGFPASHVAKGEGPKAARMYRESIDLTLKRLRTDHVDLYIIHGVNEPWKLHMEELHDEFLRQKKAGKIRHFGFSIHIAGPPAEEILREGLDRTTWYDVVYLRMNPLNLEGLKPLLLHALKKDIGILGMKIIGFGEDKDRENPNLPVYGDLFKEKDSLSPFQRRYAYILRKAPIPGILCEIDSDRKLEEDVALPTLKVSESEWKEIETAALRDSARSCRFCGACNQGCVRGLPVNDIVRIRAYGTEYGYPDDAKRLYALLRPTERGRVCSDCERCAVRCPSGIDLRETLLDAERILA